MAVLKHTSSKNTNYTDIINYMLFKYDETIDKPILDDLGYPIMRDEYYIDGINCDPMTFDFECKRLNTEYKKNQTYKEVKTHQYIISFDPKDVTEHGLTGERAHALGLEYAKKNFPGHQILVATHTDGNNNSGNIHVHIVLNSLRKYDVPVQPFMERDCDHKAGYKYHQTNQLLQYLKMDLMELCEREGLNQVDLLPPITNKISHAESKATQKGQRKLDEINQQIIKDGLTPAKTKYQTQKQYIKDAILDIANSSDAIEEFKTLLRDKYKIHIHDKRGRFSYLHPEREKPISEQALGTAYSKRVILSLIEKNQNTRIEPIYKTDPIAIFTYPSDLRLVIDLQNCIKAQQNTRYAQKVKISNLQQMANTLIFLQENQINSLDQLQLDYTALSTNIEMLSKQKEELNKEITKLSEEIHYLGQYYANKKYFSAMLKADNKTSYRNLHQDKLEKYEEARRFLKSEFASQGINFPSLDSIKEKQKKAFVNSKKLNRQIHQCYQQKQQFSIVLENTQSLLTKQQQKEKNNIIF